VFTTAQLWSPSSVRRIQFTPWHVISVIVMLLLLFQLHQDIPSGLFPSRFHIMCISDLSHACYMPHPLHKP